MFEIIKSFINMLFIKRLYNIRAYKKRFLTYSNASNAILITLLYKLSQIDLIINNINCNKHTLKSNCDIKKSLFAMQNYEIE